MDDKDYYLSKNLYEKILKATNEITKSQRNPSADFLITNSEVANTLNDLRQAEEIRVLREKKLKRILKKNKDN